MQALILINNAIVTTLKSKILKHSLALVGYCCPVIGLAYKYMKYPNDE